MARRRSWWPTGTWTAAIFFALRDGVHVPHAVVVRWITGGASTLCFAAIGVLMLRLRELRLLAWAVVLAYLLIGCHWFQPWYAAWLIALAALVPDRRVASYTLIFCFFHAAPSDHPAVRGLAPQTAARRVSRPVGRRHLARPADPGDTPGR
jgi:hypothetical protein